MPKIAVEVHHHLERIEAIHRMEKGFFKGFEERLGPDNMVKYQIEWNQGVCAFRIKAVDRPLVGVITVLGRTVRLVADMPTEAGIYALKFTKAFRDTVPTLLGN